VSAKYKCRSLARFSLPVRLAAPCLLACSPIALHPSFRSRACHLQRPASVTPHPKKNKKKNENETKKKRRRRERKEEDSTQSGQRSDPLRSFSSVGLVAPRQHRAVLSHRRPRACFSRQPSARLPLQPKSDATSTIEARFKGIGIHTSLRTKRPKQNSPPSALETNLEPSFLVTYHQPSSFAPDLVSLLPRPTTRGEQAREQQQHHHHHLHLHHSPFALPPFQLLPSCSAG
jgi:hypothetical protein